MSYRPRIIPALLLSGRGLVKTLQFRDPVYVGDPINAVRVFNDYEADELILLDIEATTTGKPIQFSLIRQVAEEAYMPLSYGGGIKTMDDVERLIQSGVEKIVLNSVLENDAQFIGRIAARYGSQAVVACIDLRYENGAYNAYHQGGTKKSVHSCSALLAQYQKEGAGEIMLQFADRDGTGKGYEVEAIRRFSAEVNIPLIACGGAASPEDFKTVTSNGASAAAAGSLFCFLGSRNSIMINYPDKIELNELFSNDQE